MTAIDFVAAATALSVCVVVTCCGATVLSAIQHRRGAAAPTSRDWLDEQLTRELVVHTVDNQTVRGLLDRVSPDGVVLAAARYLGPEGEIDLAGELFVPRAKVRFIQRLGQRGDD